jgi:hypothetical protein
MCVEEEVVLLEEQLASAHADIQRLQSALTQAEARTASGDEVVARLNQDLEAARNSLAERDSQLVALGEEATVLRASLGETEQRAGDAVQRYRDAVLAREPELPADLVAGDTVHAVDESLARARETVARVRQHLEEQAYNLRVPAGAPVRSAPDLSALSAAEKIRLGLQQT